MGGIKTRKSPVYDPTQDCKLVGAVRALSGVTDAITIVHARPGCHCGILLLRALGSNQNDIRIVGTAFHAQDMIYGAERTVADSIRLSYENFEPALIAVLNCSAPAIMGDDIEGVILSLKKEIPAEILSLSTGGYEGPAWIGYEETLTELTRFMVERDKEENSVNIIGFKQDEIRAYSDLLEIERMLNRQGITVNSVLTNSRFEVIKKASKASLNIVLGGDGLESAKSMKEKFDLPYVITPYPFGLNNSIDFMELVTRALNKEINREFIAAEKEAIKERIEKVFLLLEGIYDTSVAVVGDGGRAFDLAKFLSDELGFNVKILAITSKNYLTRDRVKEDYFELLLIEPDRLEMNEAIKSGGVEMIFGSSMEKKLAFELGVPQVRIFSPVLDEVSISDSPYAGFKGTIQLTETIINAVICNYAEI
uniref:Light-independent protochlorophyllide reductase subunit B n=1 Tax=Candidatus Methanophaga sp. ANME-1 ERB7 TaxID=2759913 RepID=A0A7G9Z4S2_9EURY|nr:light-independent protochlorophyllide reductase subunit B [Methanosarcinales archaeon ANME-1 ERB7]